MKNKTSFNLILAWGFFVSAAITIGSAQETRARQPEEMQCRGIQPLIAKAGFLSAMGSETSTVVEKFILDGTILRKSWTVDYPRRSRFVEILDDDGTCVGLDVWKNAKGGSLWIGMPHGQAHDLVLRGVRDNVYGVLFLKAKNLLLVAHGTKEYDFASNVKIAVFRVLDNRDIDMGLEFCVDLSTQGVRQGVHFPAQWVALDSGNSSIFVDRNGRVIRLDILISEGKASFELTELGKSIADNFFYLSTASFASNPKNGTFAISRRVSTDAIADEALAKIEIAKGVGLIDLVESWNDHNNSDAASILASLPTGDFRRSVSGPVVNLDRFGIARWSATGFQIYKNETSSWNMESAISIDLPAVDGVLTLSDGQIWGYAVVNGQISFGKVNWNNERRPEGSDQ